MSLLSKKISEYQERKAKILQGGGDKAVAKQIAMGKLPARERINMILDPDSFYEYDLFIKHDAREFGMENKTACDRIGILGIFHVSEIRVDNRWSAYRMVVGLLRIPGQYGAG